VSCANHILVRVDVRLRRLLQPIHRQVPTGFLVSIGVVAEGKGQGSAAPGSPPQKKLVVGKLSDNFRPKMHI